MATFTEADPKLPHSPAPGGSEKPSIKQWWFSDWGPGPLISLALPLMISAGFVSVTLFTDRTLLYWQSEGSASAAMGAGALYWSLICLPMGLLTYISTFVSQYRGAGQQKRVGIACHHAYALAWCLVPLFVLAFVVARQVFVYADHSPELVTMEATYLRVLLLGGVGVLFYSVQSGLLTGQGRTKTVLAIDGIATFINLLLDAILIFGFGPIPAFGILGAAAATSFSFWLKIPMAAWVISRDRRRIAEYGLEGVGIASPLRHLWPGLRSLFGGREHHIHDFAWEPSMFGRIIYFGTPAGLQMLAEAGCFTLIMLQVGGLGELEMAATTLALGLNVLAFVPMIGLGIGVGVLVGQHLTEGRVDLARRTVTCAIGVSLLYTGFFALSLGLAPQVMSSIYGIGVAPERFARMQPLLVPLLRIVAIYCVMDGLQVVFVGAIKGAGDTLFVLMATFFISFCAVTAGIFCQELMGNSLMLWWYIIAAWVLSMAIVFAARFFSAAWESKRVIEAS